MAGSFHPTTLNWGELPADVLKISGKDRVDLLHRLASNDLRILSRSGACVSTLFTDNHGKIVDWVFISAREHDLLMRTSHGRGTRMRSWIDRYTFSEDIQVQDVTTEWQPVMVQLFGQTLTQDFPELSQKNSVELRWQSYWNRSLLAFGTRVEGLVPTAQWADVKSQFEHRGGQWVGPEVWEAARLKAGVPSADFEFKEDINPLEIRLVPYTVSFTKGCYVGQEVIARMDSYDKVARLLMGFEMLESFALNTEARLHRGEVVIGRPTSFAIVGGSTVGLALVKREEATPGPISIVQGDRVLQGELVDRPFWKSS